MGEHRVFGVRFSERTAIRAPGKCVSLRDEGGGSLAMEVSADTRKVGHNKYSGLAL